MRSNYVRGASMSCSALQAEIQEMLVESGASGFRLASEQGKAAIAFSAGDRQFRLVLSQPGSADSRLEPEYDPLQPHSTGHESKTMQEAARKNWWQLAVLIRAKLDAVAKGIVTFDEEFLAYMVMPGGATVFQATGPAITTAYAAARKASSRDAPPKEARRE
ncbi:hypothetical protein [Sinomonas sp. ASV322]|uniref:hypothetical protein n=1 Tax=Sinomonas sp. ASV322 TaxID=3041920 RepID=UPI0027DDC0AE|nr:hypothetical protein [Sinomonas sp. ASV322]MDQ4504308.1 hypothetical protein [Sinomonas sp. ASV322]